MSLSGRFNGVQGLHMTGDWIRNRKGDSCMGCRIVNWPASGRVGMG